MPTLVPRRDWFGPRATVADGPHTVFGRRRHELVMAEVGVLLVLVSWLSGGAWAGVGMPVGLVMGLTSVVNLRGRPPVRWIPKLKRYRARRGRGDTSFRSPAAARAAGLPVPEGAPSLPPGLAGLRLLTAGEQGRVAVVHDPARDTYTAICALQPAVPANVVVSTQAWDRVLTAVSDSPVCRTQWVWRARRAPSGDREEIFVAVQVTPTRDPRAVSRAGGGEAGAAEVCATATSRVADTLTATGIPVRTVLSELELVDALARGYSPGRVPFVADTQSDGDGRQRPEPAPELQLVAPVAGEESWSSYRADDAWHATYWIAGWPTDPQDAVAALATSTTTVSVTLRPPGLRNDPTGQPNPTAGQPGFTGVVGVSEASRERLRRACEHLERRARAHRIRVVRLYGEQERAFVATLPLAVGG